MFPQMYLVSDILTYKDNFDAAPHGSALTPRYDNITADAGISVAVCAASGQRTWSFETQTDTVRRGCDVSDSGDAVLYTADDFVHADDYDHMFRPKAERSYTVAGPVDID